MENRKYDGALNALGKAEGSGTLTTPDLTYEGMWKNDKYHGKGTLKYIKIGKIVEGSFEDGKFTSGKITLGKEIWKGVFSKVFI